MTSGEALALAKEALPGGEWQDSGHNTVSIVLGGEWIVGVRSVDHSRMRFYIDDVMEIRDIRQWVREKIARNEQQLAALRAALGEP